MTTSANLSPRSQSPHVDVFSPTTAPTLTSNQLQVQTPLQNITNDPSPSIINRVSLGAVPKALDVCIVDFYDLSYGSEAVKAQIKEALAKNGIVGVKSIPTYSTHTKKYLEAVLAFHNLPQEVKNKYAPNRNAGEWLGYEIGAEQFTRDDGTKVVDKAKVSYYAVVKPGDNNASATGNVWPKEVDLEGPYLALGRLMTDTAKEVLKMVDFDETRISLNNINGIGRLLHYQPDPENSNPDWCGAHFDHGLFTALMPAFYFKDGEPVKEPEEAGLFIQKPGKQSYRKVVSSDPEVMLFQVGEFAQLDTDGRMQATKHLVRKADDKAIERVTMAVFLGPDNEATIESNNVLASDERYGNRQDGKCRYLDWHLASLKRYQAK